ncbi:hypothetical protein C3L33_09570, partial [Rhododendron williamsianum]
MVQASSSSRPHQAYVRALSRKGPGDYQMEFYSVPINDENVSGGEDGTVRVLTPIKAANVPLHGGFAAVDNKLYCIGGDPPSNGSVYRPVRSLYTFDTSCRLPTKSPWKKRPSMRIGRFFPHTVVVDGKIFVFEGIDGPDPVPRPWAEVFDTKSGRWSSLSPPSQLPTAYGMFAVALPDHGKILVGSCEDDFFYTYYVGDGRWERWDHKIVLDIPCNVKPAALDTTLFWFYDCRLHAYDLTDKCRHQATLLHCVKFSISDLVFQGGKTYASMPLLGLLRLMLFRRHRGSLMQWSYLGVVDMVDISKLRMFKATLMYDVGEVGVEEELRAWYLLICGGFGAELQNVLARVLNIGPRHVLVLRFGTVIHLFLVPLYKNWRIHYGMSYRVVTDQCARRESEKVGRRRIK